ncbi:hypothetical protein PsorP6_003133 [Peronosclerospora sorghi]|uniref:Uncharacterized protein n=1 Tax=Peronosclerospora sorghi TaxID=230839 RepID=A0ACC0VNR1_9STRA|nr:hypothetical protein PsorP6_003133 [Peronosclerospora sorghi]
MTSNNNETMGQAKQRHKLELRTLQIEVKAFQKKSKKIQLIKKEIEAQERHNQKRKAFETKEENTTTFISHTNEADEAASLATKQAKAQEKLSASEKTKRSRKENDENASMKLTKTQ